MDVHKESGSQFADTADRQAHISRLLGFWLERIVRPDLMITFTFRQRGDRNGLMRVPSRGWAVAQSERFFDELERAAGGRIAWVMVVDFGRRTRRIHAHALVAGAAHLSRREWWSKAYRQFGRARIEPYRERGGGAQYIANHALTETGQIHFGGKLLDTETVRETLPVGRVVVAPSADVPSEYFRLGLGRGRRR